MNKEDLLQELADKISSGEVSESEVRARLNLDVVTTPVIEEKKSYLHFTVTKMLYILGAAIVISGIIFLIAQVWDDVGAIGQIGVTLGLGLLMAAIGSILLKQKPENEFIGPIFHFIGGVLIPIGVMVTLNEIDVDSLWPVALMFGVVFGFYLALNAIHKHPVLTFFAIANGTAFVYLLVEAIIEGPAYQHDDLHAYLTMIVGISYLLLGRSFKGSWNKILLPALYFFGITGLLTAAFTRIFDSTVWEMSYLLLILAGLVLSIYLKSRIILIMTTIFLISYVTYITQEYFADSLGWPLALVILGFLFIGLGYGSVTISNKFIKRSVGVS